jgi:hypothetical protein
MQGAVAGTPGTLPTNWGIGGIGLGTLTQQVVGTGTINGINYIDLRFSGTTSTTGFELRLETVNGIAASNGQTWAFSAWTALVGGSFANLTSSGVNANLQDSGNVFLASLAFTGFSVNTTSTLTRSSAAATIATANTASIRPLLFFTFSSGVTIDFTLRIGLPQLELGAFATSVIPTTVAAATRNADAASMTGTNFSSWYNQSEMTFYGEYAPIYTASASVPSNTPHLLQADFTASTGNNYAIRGAVNGQSQEFVARSVTFGVQFPLVSSLGFLQAGVFRKVAYGINSTQLAPVANGISGSVLTNNVASTMTTPDRLTIGTGIGGSPPYQLNGHIRRIAYYPVRLSNAQLQALTR